MVFLAAFASRAWPLGAEGSREGSNARTVALTALAGTVR
jgi:hypothetical protein